MRTLGKLILGIFLGGIVGSILAMLFAPVSGKQLRERVYDYCTNIRHDVKTAAENKRQELQQQLAALQGR